MTGVRYRRNNMLVEVKTCSNVWKVKVIEEELDYRCRRRERRWKFLLIWRRWWWLVSIWRRWIVVVWRFINIWWWLVFVRRRGIVVVWRFVNIWWWLVLVRRRWIVVVWRFINIWWWLVFIWRRGVVVVWRFVVIWWWLVFIWWWLVFIWWWFVFIWRVFGLIRIVVWLASIVRIVVSSSDGRNYAKQQSIDKWRQVPLLTWVFHAYEFELYLIGRQVRMVNPYILVMATSIITWIIS